MRCLQEKTGSCAGCNVLSLTQRDFRWRNDLNVGVARASIARQYCPSGCCPQARLLVNHQASLAMGQRREENTGGDGGIGVYWRRFRK